MFYRQFSLDEPQDDVRSRASWYCHPWPFQVESDPVKSPVGTDVARAAAILRDGGLVAFATETVYGLGGNALDVAALARIFEVKKRPRFDPLIVHLADRAQVADLVTEFPSSADQLADRFWPGPLTLVLPKSSRVPDLATSGLPTVAVRIPDHPQAIEFLRAAGVPTAAPSANLFGRLSPTSAEAVADQLGDAIDYILDGGSCRVGVESTVIDVTDPSAAVLLRPGGLPQEEIEAVVGPLRLPDPADHPSTRAQLSPGMLPRHYAPRTPLEVSASPVAHSGEKTGLLLFRPSEDVDAGRFEAIEALTATGDLREAAAGFFAALRRLDGLGLDRIVATPFPDEGLGRALNDRLRRAGE